MGKSLKLKKLKRAQPLDGGTHSAVLTNCVFWESFDAQVSNGLILRRHKFYI